VFLASPFIGLYSKRFKDLKFLTIGGFICFAAFFGKPPHSDPCSSISYDSSGSMLSVGLGSRTGMWIYPVFFGLGLAAGLTGLMAAAQFGAPPDSM
jgi:hypothetical protein